ncbi:MAG: flagellar hook-length control protein FliK [Muribaculum sp.]|nr:flagellar hook-length control protein FliK [Muribaculum sp.]
MKTNAVKDTGSVMNLGVQAGRAAGRAGDGFRTVWNSQTNGGKAAPQKEQLSGKQVQKARPGDELRAKDQSRKNVREEDADQIVGAVDNAEPENPEAAMEAMSAAVMELMQKIADTFGISVEALQETMADLDLQPVDLLQPENLSSLLLAAGGAEDSLALLTDEQLFEDYRMLMEEGRAAAEQAGIPAERMTTAEELPEQPVQPEQSVQIETAVQAQRPADVQESEDEAVGAADVDNTAVQAAAGETDGQIRAVQNAKESADSREGGEAKQEGEAKPGEAGANLVLQSIKDGLTGERTESAQEASGTQEADMQDVMQQIMDYMRVQIKPGMSSLEMQLHPESLGTLQIHLAAKGGALTASFIAQNESVKAALESQMVQLKESFEEQGVKVEAIEVTVQTHEFEQNLEQGRGRQPQESAEGKRPRTRRITLNGFDEPEFLGETEEEDRMTAEMMAASGTTVDYTA